MTWTVRARQMPLRAGLVESSRPRRAGWNSTAGAVEENVQSSGRTSYVEHEADFLSAPCRDVQATPLFYLPYCWYGQHVVSHHTHTNEEEFDLDLHHFHGTKVHPDGETPAKLGPVPLWKVSLQAHWLLATIAMSYIYPLQHLAAAIGSALSGTPIDIATTGDSRRTPHFKVGIWTLPFACAFAAFLR